MESRRPSVTCKQFVEALEAYVAGELSPSRRSRLQQHARECTACRLYLESYRATIDLARRSAETEAQTKDAELPERIVQRIVEARRERGD